MQAVILAAGKSSRFYPFNQKGHKSHLKLLGKSIIEHTILSIKQAGITDVIVVTRKDGSLQNELGNGDKIGVKITYATQNEPQGMGDALLQVKDHIRGSFFLLHPSHVDFHEFASEMREVQESDDKAVLLAKYEENVTEYGVLKIDGKRVLDIIEKPEKGTEPTNLRIIGIYLLPSSFLDTLGNTSKAHYNLESAIVEFASSHNVTFLETEKNIISLKYTWQLLQMSSYLLKSITKNISESAEIAQSAVIKGNVVIGENAKILEGACIKGPCYIGPNSVVGNNALLRDNVVLEEGSVVGAFMEVRGSIILSHTSLHSGFVGDSIVGENTKIGAEFLTANVRIDREHVHATVNERKVSSGTKALGVIVGDNVRVGVRVTTMPGVILGNGSMIGPSTTVMKNVKENTRYYSTFTEVVEDESNS